MKESAKAEDMLNDIVKPMEILEYLDKKYDSYKIVSQKTIKRWMVELDIQCIQPRPARNKDIRYKKSDILKLEKEKQYSLLKKAKQQVKEYEIRKIGHASRKSAEEKFQAHYDALSAMTDEERRESEFQESITNYSVPAENIIKEDMLDMCFKKLFPNVGFSRKELEVALYIKNNSDQFSDLEYGEAKLYVDEKAYITKGKINKLSTN